ncbi:CoA transferase [Arthrobacter sp. FW306-2-2C-D06B]|uniref:CoA transferase n=1 Tax=Arthrobacter sp. FW306-2-2C-D06B TaxID=2879618 RepID=UPI001F293326|nr:CoA transferase [Arthrobacter sp. FW306-2-2C-D06B]UKA60494.1 CoA transferase [Arthrobacter sp. FW306-2-2C-D06B]
MLSTSTANVDTANGPSALGTSWLTALRVVKIGDSSPLKVAGQVLSQFGANVIDGADLSSNDQWGNPDIVLVDRIEAAPDLPGLPAGNAQNYLDYVSRNNRSVWVTASAYGLSNSRADAFASEMTLLAAGGILGHSRIADDLPPTLPAGSLGLSLAGDVMAMAALHGVHEHLATSQPVHIDLSAQGAVVANGMSLEMAHALANCPDEGGSGRYGAPTGFFECTDGSVFVCTLEQHQWAAFRTTLHPTLDSIVTLEEARTRSHEVNLAMAAWASTRTAAHCEMILQSAGVPCTAVNTIERLLERLREVGRPLDVMSAHAPNLPAIVEETPGKEPAEDRSGVIPLKELRVLDAGHVLAVPLATSWLGAMGARVTKHEDPDRLDLYRRRGPFSLGVPGVNRSAYFNQLNFCKTQMIARVDENGGALDLSSFDVVTNNLSPRRAQLVGVDLSTAVADSVPRLAVSSSGFGRIGEWSHYRAYGHNIHAFAGLVAATRDARGEMNDVGTPWADPLTSVAIATWVLAWSLATERTSSVAADMSMAEIMAAQLTSLIGSDPQEAYLAQPGKADFFLRTPQLGRLIAVSLRNAEEILRFESLIGLSLPSMKVRGELIDVPLDALHATHDHELAEKILDAGFAASLVLNAQELASDPFLRSTGLFQTVESAALGEYDVTGLPWHFVGSDTIPIWAAPEINPAENG